MRKVVLIVAGVALLAGAILLVQSEPPKREKTFDDERREVQHLNERMRSATEGLTKLK